MAYKNLSDMLYEKMYAELDAYREQLKRLSPNDILAKASEYVVKQDIVMYVASAYMDDHTATVLLKVEKPLEEIYEALTPVEPFRNQRIEEAVHTAADRLEIHIPDRGDR